MSADQRELRGVVEQEENAPNRLCIYRTAKTVRIRDTRLGCLYWFLVTLVMLYMVLIALSDGRMHQFPSVGVGIALTDLHGKAVFQGKAYDEFDLMFRSGDSYGTFLATRIVKVRGQTAGRCTDFTQPCHCKAGSAGCAAGHFCEKSAWCPSLGDGNAAKPPAGAEVIRPDAIENIKVNIVPGISFPGIAGDPAFVADGLSNPLMNGTLANLLKNAEPPLSLAQVRDSGALIGVSFLWNCDVVLNCEPAVSVRRLDNGAGFSEHRSWQYVGPDGLPRRDAELAFGLRIVVDSSGYGYRTSAALVLVQIGSFLALLRLASWLTDFVMLVLCSQDRREKYNRFKILEVRRPTHHHVQRARLG